MKNILLAFLVAFTTISCNQDMQSTPSVTIFNDQLADSMKDYQAAYERQRTEIEFENGGKASTCESYINNSQRFPLKEGVNNQSRKSEYLDCDVMSLIGDRKFLRENGVSSVVESLAKHLDLRSFPSSLYQRLDDKNYTINNLADRKQKLSTNAVIYEPEGWFYQLEVVAVADVNNNKKPDWILWLIDEATQGNYRNYQTLVIFDPDPAAQKLQATLYPYLVAE